MLRTISNKIAIAALAVTMIIVLTLGVVSYMFARLSVTYQINEKIAFEASVVRGGLESLLVEIDNSVRNVSENLIVVNALIDSVGRDIYIEPFIKSYKLPSELPFTLTLCDFEGKPIATSRENMVFSPDNSMLEVVVGREQPFADIRDARDGKKLLISYPVFYGATGMAEGMLIIEVPFAALVAAAPGLSFQSSGRILKITAHGDTIWGDGKGVRKRMQSLFFMFNLEKPLVNLALAMEYGQPTEEIDDALHRLTLLYLGIAIVVLCITFLLSRYIAHRLTLPLMTLSKVADKVATTGMPDARIDDIASDDEVKTLASSFNTMMEKLRESHLTLERRVAERTRELGEANEKLQTSADTQNVLLREVNHRVKNNLTTIISMLHKEEDRARDEGMIEFVSRLQEVVSRISGLLVVHSLLSSSRWNPLSLSFLCDNIIQAALRGVSVRKTFELEVVGADDTRVNSDQAHYLAIVLNELATNTMKYAMREQTSVHIRVRITQRRKFLQLVYQDDGPGYPETVLAGEFAKSSIGIPLIFGIIRKSLQGEVNLSNEHGAKAYITFPRAFVER